MIFDWTAGDRKVRVFSLSQGFLDDFMDKQPPWGFGGLGYFTYKRCVAVETPVLCDDLVWRSAGGLAEGQGIVGFDEEPIRVHHYDYRYLRLGVVTHNHIEDAETVGIELENGMVLYATPDHSWLAKYAVGNRIYWRESKDLGATKKGGDVYLMRPFGPVWNSDDTYEGGFLSAAYDGEGSLDRLNGVTFTQKDNVFLSRVEDYLTGMGFPYKKFPKKGKSDRMFILRMHGLRRLLPFLGELQPPRLLERFRQGIEKNLGGTLLRCAPEDWVKVVRVFPAGTRKIAVMSTSLKTHFTGGFASHNTYARDLPDGTTEEWWQTCRRVIEGCFNIQKIHCRQQGLPWDEAKAQVSAQEMYRRMFCFKWSPPGRGLWMMGTDVVYERGAAALLNCGFHSTDRIGEDFSAPYTFLMDLSMLGVGIGLDTRGAGKVRIHTPKLWDSFTVEDTREGWVALLAVVLESFVGKGAFPSVIDYTKVRGRGVPLKTFGGIASGPRPLQDLIQNIVNLLLPSGVTATFDVKEDLAWGTIDKATISLDGIGEPYRITSTQIVDLANYVGKAVVAGGIRRTAEIMFGDPTDQDFVNLKQDLVALNDRRWASNNSIFAPVGMDYSPILDSLIKNGEPGLCWMDNVRRFSRMNGVADDKDRRVMGLNPCMEQPLESAECCNLVETYPAHHDSYADFQKTLKMAYLYAKTVTLVPTHIPRANAIMTRNRRIGCSMSGIVQAMQKLGRRQFLTWCNQGYDYIQQLDRIYSDWLGIPLSIKTTTVKPSGCRPWYALTCTSRGLLTLEELFKDHPEGQDWADIAGNVEADGNGCRVSRSYVNGMVPVNRITLSYGLTLESSLNHQWEVIGKELDNPRKKGGVSSRFVPYLVPAWVATKDLQPGDVLSVHPGVYKHRTAQTILKPLSSVALKMRGDADEIRQPDTMTPDLAWLLGYLWGDGAMSPSRWRLRWVDGVRANLDKAVKILHDLFGIEAEIKPASGTHKAWTMEVASKMLWHWLIKNGIFKYDADRLDLIPYAVRASGGEVIIAFVAGLLDADGSAGAWGRWGKAVITTADARFAQHLQDVCWAVGLCFGRGHQTKGKSMWHLTSAAVMDTEAFAVLVRHSVKAGAFAATATFLGWHHEHAERTLRVGKVVSNESAGEMPTFDVEVEQAHWYYAGAVKSHNTVSLLAGATPGIHYPHSAHYIRHVRVQNTSPLIQVCKDAGYPVEPDVYADDTSVVAFPVQEEHFVKGKDQVTMWEQFHNAADMQRNWSDNAVSVTVTFKQDETKDIKACLEAYEDRLKGISLLPLGDKDHGYKQAPYVAIDEPTYTAMMARVTPLRFATSVHDRETEDRFCSGDKCTLGIK